MNKHRVATPKAPQAIGPYSQAIVSAGWVFCSGQLGLSPEKGELVPGGIEAEAKQALQNLEAVLEAAGSSLELVVKATIFVTDLGSFAALNAVYGRCFRGVPPARSTVQVAALPRGASVEIEAIAALAQT